MVDDIFLRAMGIMASGASELNLFTEMGRTAAFMCRHRYVVVVVFFTVRGMICNQHTTYKDFFWFYMFAIFTAS
eukprot:2697336-Ditylum_brightwellii.AAC.1